jgi:hypothetical protein
MVSKRGSTPAISQASNWLRAARISARSMRIEIRKGGPFVGLASLQAVS